MGAGEKIRVRSERLKKMIGIRANNISTAAAEEGMTSAPQVVITADETAHFNTKMNHLYLYTDIVQNSLVGNSLVPIARVINIEPGHVETETFHKMYEKPQYHELKGNTISQIQVELKDSMGTNVRFVNGEVFIALHFKPRVTARNRYYL
jgi:hypothetical protein